MALPVYVFAQHAEHLVRAQQLAEHLQLPLASVLPDEYIAVVVDDALSLKRVSAGQQTQYVPDLISGRAGYRRQHGGGMREPLVRACGVKTGQSLHVLDATGGWLRDACVLIDAGCHVEVWERHPVVTALMQDALLRARQTEAGASLSALDYRHGDAADRVRQLIEAGAKPDVIYLDPMFPARPGSALVKKDMQLLQCLCEQENSQQESLLPLARQLALKRVVVKRPDYAPPLDDQKPTMNMTFGGLRFDVYLRG